MSETASPNLASHTLAYLRRIEQRQNQLMDLVVRQQDLIGRLERDMREGFARTDRDLKELKSDVVLVENRILSSLNGLYEQSSRLTEQEDRIAQLERDPGSRPVQD